MEWWQTVLLYLGIWALGFATGYKAGVGSAAKLLLLRPFPTNAPHPGLSQDAISKILASTKGAKQ